MINGLQIPITEKKSIRKCKYYVTMNSGKLHIRRFVTMVVSAFCCHMACTVTTNQYLPTATKAHLNSSPYIFLVLVIFSLSRLKIILSTIKCIYFSYFQANTSSDDNTGWANFDNFETYVFISYLFVLSSTYQGK